MSNSTDRPSMRAPGGVPQAQRADTAPRNRAERRGRARLAASVNALLQRFHVTLADDERARFDAAVTTGRARDLGAEYSPRDVVRELARVVGLLAPWLVKSQLAPYGPLRARYALELAHATLPTLDQHAAAGATSTAGDAPVEPLTPHGRRRAMRALSKATSAPEVKAAIERAVDDKAATTARAKDHERTLARVAHVRDAMTPRMRDDVGLTDAVLAALEDEAVTELDALDAKRDVKRTRQTLRAEVAVPCGKLVVEVRQLVAAARDNRRDNPAIPAVSSRLVRAGAKAPAEAPPEPPPQPAPQPDR